ncbi:hypothetical protein U9M48_024090, partial [Paspalum notatum var. saurae]
MVHPAGGGIFSVSDKYGAKIVDINVRCYDCKRWQLTGIPCCHAIACFRHDDIRPETMVHECYSIETYMHEYGYCIWPVRDKIHWEKMNGVDVQPPMYEKKCLWINYTQQEKLSQISGYKLDGRSIEELAPRLFAVIPKRRIKQRTVQEALTNRTWISDIQGALDVGVLTDYLHLWDLLSDLQLQLEVEDRHIWKLSPNGQYSAKSAYEGLFLGAILFEPWKKIWKSRAPPKCRFFMWLAAHKKCWTADRLTRRGLPCSACCPLCDQEEETIDHLLIGCAFAREFWFKLLRQVYLQAISPQPVDSSFFVWWEKASNTTASNAAAKLVMQGVNSLIILGAWTIWNHRNKCVFDGSAPSVAAALVIAGEECRLWALAGARGLSLLTDPLSPLSCVFRKKSPDTRNISNIEDELEEYDDPMILEDIMPARSNCEMDPSKNVDTMVFNMLHEDNIAQSTMQPRGPLPDENIFVVGQRDNLPPPKVTTAMNIRCRATATRSRKKAKIVKDGIVNTECSGTRRERGRRGGRAGRTGGRGGIRRRDNNREQSQVSPKEFSTTQSAPREYVTQRETVLED